VAAELRSVWKVPSFPLNQALTRTRTVDSRFRGNDGLCYGALTPSDAITRTSVVGEFVVAALSERRNPLRVQGRRSETAATRIKLTHYPDFFSLDKGRNIG